MQNNLHLSPVKRILVVLLALLYLGAGLGFSLRQHFCMGQHIGTAIDHPLDHSDKHSCSRCGMEKKNGDNGCCQDKIIVIKASQDQLPGAHITVPDGLTAAVLPAPLYLPAVNSSFKSLSGQVFDIPDPPGSPGAPPRFLRLRCIRV
jgi:hypothetical protein